MKFCLMKVAYEHGAIQGKKVKLTTSEIAQLGGMDRHSVQCALRHYAKNEYGYFRRYKPENKDYRTKKAYRYALTKKGLEIYKRYCWNITRGYSLDLRLGKWRKVPGFDHNRDFGTSRHFSVWSRDITADDILNYMKITTAGKELGIKISDKKGMCDGIWQMGTSTEETY